MIVIVLIVLVPALIAALLWGAREATRPAERNLLRGLAPLLGGFAVVAMLFAAAVGSESSWGATLLPFVLVVVVSLTGLGFIVAKRGAVVVEQPWSAPAAAPARNEGPSTVGPATVSSVARALGRVEARELATGPWFGIGIGFCVWIFVVFGFDYSDGNGEPWLEYAQLAPWFAHPLVGMSVFAGHRAVTRAARDDVDELFDTCPAASVTRTVGFLFSAVVTVSTLVVFFVVMGVTTAVRSPLIHGPLGLDMVVDVAGAVVLGAGGIALGVALGRWVRFALAPIVAVAAIGFVTTTLNGVGGRGWNPLVALATAPTIDGPSPVFADRPTFWHLLWLIGLTMGVGVVAVARHRRDRAVALGGAASVFVVLVAGIGATRPLSPASAARIADLVASPQRHQDCAPAGGPIEVCVYRFHRELVDRVTDRVGPIGAVLPPGLPPLTLRQVYDGRLDQLPPKVRRRLTSADLVRPDREVPLGFDGDVVDVPNDPGFDIAFAAIGLPLEADEQLLPTVIAGQARGVVALWLATRGLDAGDVVKATTAAEPRSRDPFERGSLEVGQCSDPSVVWSAQDLAAARAVAALPEPDVLRIVRADWARWTDPRTGTDEFLTALGLAGVGPFDHVAPRPGRPC